MTEILRYAAFLLAPGNRGDLLPFLLVVVSELVLIMHALVSSGLSLISFIQGPLPNQDTRPHPAPAATAPDR